MMVLGRALDSRKKNIVNRRTMSTCTRTEKLDSRAPPGRALWIGFSAFPPLAVRTAATHGLGFRAYGLGSSGRQPADDSLPAQCLALSPASAPYTPRPETRRKPARALLRRPRRRLRIRNRMRDRGTTRFSKAHTRQRQRRGSRPVQGPLGRLLAGSPFSPLTTAAVSP